MPLINLVIVLIIIGLVIYLIDLLPIDAGIKKIIRALIIVVVILWLLTLFLPISWTHFQIGHP
jgi:hypothetical protein